MRRVGVVTLSQLWENYKRARKEVKKDIVKGKKEVRKSEWYYCKLFWTYFRGKKEGRVRRMKDAEGRMVEGEDEALEVIENTWKSLARKGKILKQRWEMWVGMSWICVRK